MSETRVELLGRIYRLEETIDALFDTLKSRDRTIDGLLAELESRRHPPVNVAGIIGEAPPLESGWKPGWKPK